MLQLTIPEAIPFLSHWHLLDFICTMCEPLEALPHTVFTLGEPVPRKQNLFLQKHVLRDDWLMSEMLLSV